MVRGQVAAMFVKSDGSRPVAVWDSRPVAAAVGCAPAGRGQHGGAGRVGEHVRRGVRILLHSAKEPGGVSMLLFECNGGMGCAAPAMRPDLAGDERPGVAACFDDRGLHHAHRFGPLPRDILDVLVRKPHVRLRAANTALTSRACCAAAARILRQASMRSAQTVGCPVHLGMAVDLGRALDRVVALRSCAPEVWQGQSHSACLSPPRRGRSGEADQGRGGGETRESFDGVHSIKKCPSISSIK